MDKTELLNAISTAAGHLTDFWIIKLIMAVFVAAICNLHVQLLAAFAAIVLIDLATKWIAISHQYLIDSGNNPESLNVWDCIKGIKAARREGYIKSSEMKHRFAGKMAVYVMLTLGAAVADLIMHIMAKPEYLVILVVGYLSATELMSIVENLQAAGVDEAAKLKDIIEQKRGRL